MTREKKIERFIFEHGIDVFKVERIARGHYKIFKSYNEYTSFKLNNAHYSDTVTYSYGRIFEVLTDMLEEQKAYSDIA